MCPEFVDALTGNLGACAREVAAIKPACPTLCNRTLFDDGPNGCAMGQACPGETPTTFECEGDTCSCKVGDEVQTQCDSAGICSQGWEAQAGAANVCCGFEY